MRTILEECDLGACPGTGGVCNDGAYGGCNADCTLAPFCGDGVIDPPHEVCDDGLNTTTGYAMIGCAPGCVLPPMCGDGVIDLGEQCDDGPDNLTGTQGGCSATCTLNPFCGDGIVQSEHGEGCDHGDANAPPDQVEYGGCTTLCTLGPYCGDGIRQNPPEYCDDGNNVDGDGCSAICVTEMLVE